MCNNPGAPARFQQGGMITNMGPGSGGAPLMGGGIRNMGPGSMGPGATGVPDTMRRMGPGATGVPDTMRRMGPGATGIPPNQKPSATDPIGSAQLSTMGPTSVAPTQFSGEGALGFVAGRPVQTPGAEQDVPGILELAYGLMAEPTPLPGQQVAGFTPAQLQAFEMAQQGIGAFQPFLDEASGLTRGGVAALEQAQAGTLALGQQIPGVVAPGQSSLAGAEQLALGATSEGMAQLGQAGAATGELAAQIPGVVAPGQAALGQAQSTAQQASLAGQAGLGASEADIRALGGAVPGATQMGQGALLGAGQMAQNVALGGIGGLSGTGAMFDPSQIRPFMNEFEDAAVQQALADIRREGQIAGTGLRAQAVGSGAFGGSRQAVAEQELQRNVFEQQARTAAQMRAAGFESAAQRSQSAFEQALARQQAGVGLGANIGFQGAGMMGQTGLQAAQLGMAGLGQQQAAAAQAAQLSQAAAQLGITEAQLQGQLGLQGAQLGLQGLQTGLGAQQQAAGIAGQQAGLGLQGAQTAGGLGLQSSQLGLQGVQAGLGAQQQAAGIGQGIAGLGQQMAGLGQAQQQMNLQDLNTLLTTGSQQQALAQAQLDAERANQLQSAMQPFQQLAFLSDIATGAPSGQISAMTQPGPSIGSQMLGLGIGAYGLSRAAPSIFGGGN